MKPLLYKKTITCLFSGGTPFPKPDREPTLSESSAKKQIKNTKQILSFAETHNYIDKNPIQKFRCGGDDTDVTPLEFHEVKNLWEKNITIQRLAEVRDALILL